MTPERLPIIHYATEVAKYRLTPLNWLYVKTARPGIGPAVFRDPDGREFSLELGYWWPPGASHLDDEPGIAAYFTDSNGRIAVPQSNDVEALILFHHSPPETIEAAAHRVVDNFLAFLKAPPRFPGYVCVATSDRILVQTIEAPEKKVLTSLNFKKVEGTYAAWELRSVFSPQALSALLSKLRDDGFCFLAEKNGPASAFESFRNQNLLQGSVMRIIFDTPTKWRTLAG